MPSPSARTRTWVAAVTTFAVLATTALALVATGLWSPWTGTGGRDGAQGQADDRPDRDAGGRAGDGGGVPEAGPSGARPYPATHFLDTYVDDDGRVVRTDQGGDTVSEGQAYGLMLAVATADEERFDLIWRWTVENLQRPDGLLSWTWEDGRVTDESTASDADLDAAHALVAAGDRFDRPDLYAEGLRVGEAVLDHETALTPLGRVLTAGTWASTGPWDVNPSYSSPVAVSYLAQASGDPRWAELAAGNRAVLDELLSKAPLPPDWAQVRRDGEVVAMPSPGNADGAGDVRFGLDAARISIRAGASCDPADRSVAAGLDEVLSRPAHEVRGAYDLGGSPVVEWRHPLQLVAAAASAGAGGDVAVGRELMVAASELDQQVPTYYGAAWTALGDVLLQERSSLLPDDCGAEPPITADAEEK